jgi:hypothetical protein
MDIHTPNENASGQAGVSVAGGQAKATRKNKIFKCGVQHISKLRQELQKNGLALRDASGTTQIQTLIRVLQYLGDRGFNTPEAVGCGFYRIATRIQELEADGWLIASRRECLIGADGLVHSGIARYALLGRSSTVQVAQLSLALEEA